MTAAASDPSRISPARRIALTWLAMTATLMQVLDSTIANVALPHMQAALNGTLAEKILSRTLVTLPRAVCGSLIHEKPLGVPCTSSPTDLVFCRKARDSRLQISVRRCLRSRN